MMRKLLSIGTSSWSSADWVGTFYPDKMKPTDFLRFYATKYDTVEVDSTFYRLPTAWLCKKWAKDTPETFRFALKVTRDITHDKVLVGCEEEWEKFLGAVGELGPRLGFIVFQFGYFNKQSACPDVGTFLKRLADFSKRCPNRHEYVVEIRNPRWISEEFLETLREHRFSFALTDQQWMPRPTELWEKFGEKLFSRNHAYIRFLGERERIEKITKTWEKIVIDRTKETKEWVETVIRQALAKRIPVWVYINNHFAGHAPTSIDLLSEAIRDSGLE